MQSAAMMSQPDVRHSLRQAQARARPTERATGRHWIAGIEWVMALGIVAIVLMHVTSTRSFFGDALSSYAFSPIDPILFRISVLSLAVCAVLIPVSLRSAGLKVGIATSALFGAWGSGLTLAVMFPAAYGEHPDFTSGAIHQYSCALAFTTLPASMIGVIREARQAGVLARRRLPLTRLLRIAIVCLAFFGLSYLAKKLSYLSIFDAISIILPVAMTQRIVLGADIVVLVGIVLLAARTSHESRHDNHKRRDQQ